MTFLQTKGDIYSFGPENIATQLYGIMFLQDSLTDEHITFALFLN